AQHFMDVYHRGLDGKWAAWAAKCYRGHQMLPEGLMAKLELTMAKEEAARSEK
ncbi:hypothetical protein B0H14DRAFT_2374612, partial [Mycena olivaceomarginata]